MPLFTPNFNLPYPSGSDEPCDFDEDWCHFTTALDGVLDGFDETALRTYPTVPVARLELTTPIELVSPAIIPFDAVSVDTAGWIDFDADPTGITVDRGGWISILAVADFVAAGAAGAVWNWTVLSALIATESYIEQAAETVVALKTANVTFNSSPTKYQLQLTRSLAPTTTFTVNRAQFSIWWHSDTATP